MKNCDKICKSKGGLTRHRRSKHPESKEASTSNATKGTFMPAVDYALMVRFLTEIVKKLCDEKFYPEAILTAVTNVKPIEEFLGKTKPGRAVGQLL